MSSGAGGAEAATVLRRNLAEGLHAAAQPLSVLRMTLDPQAVESQTPVELARLVEKLSGEVDRLCRIFSGLQQMVQIEANPAQRASTDLSQLASSVVEDLRLYFEEAGIGLRCELEAPALPLELEPKRIGQALTIVLLGMHGLSLAGDTVEVDLELAGPGVQRLTVCNRGIETEKLDHEPRLQLALAETILRSQGASFGYALKPFAAVMEFATPPVA